MEVICGDVKIFHKAEYMAFSMLKDDVLHGTRFLSDPIDGVSLEVAMTKESRGFEHRRVVEACVHVI